MPPRNATRRRFARRGFPLWASPGSRRSELISIFASLGLRRLRSSSATTTRHVDTVHAFSRPRAVRPDRKAGSRCPRVPIDLRRWRGTASDVPMNPAPASHVRLAASHTGVGLGAHRPGDIESRALPRRKGSSPGSTMSRAPVGHRLRPRALGGTRADARSIEASHMRGLTRARQCYPPWSACREATRPS